MKRRISVLLLVLALLCSTVPFAMAQEPADLSDAVFSGLTADGDTILATDLVNKVIWRIKGNEAELYAGTVADQGASGLPAGAYIDGTRSEARFLEPWAMSPFLDGWAISDAGLHAVRYVTDKGVFTLTGTGNAGCSTGRGTGAALNYPTGLATDPNGNLYIADTGNGRICKMDTNGWVSVYAAGLNDPTGLCWYKDTLYVAETGADRICKIENGNIVTVCGGKDGFADGPAAKAALYAPQGIAFASDGALLIADTGNGAVRRFADGRITTLAASDTQSIDMVQPRSILVQGDKALVSDIFSGFINTVDTVLGAYSDVKDTDWFQGAVKTGSEWGLVQGIGNGKYDPEGKMNRAALVTMLQRLEQSKDRDLILWGEASFTDVKEDDWFADAVNWAASEKIVNGMPDGSFRPMDNVTRADLVTMLYRYAKDTGLDVAASAQAEFPDGKLVPSYAVDAVNWACGIGLLKGDNTGKLLPTAPATRAQVVQIFVRFMEHYGL